MKYIALLIFTTFTVVSIYSITDRDIQGNPINFSSFAGKRILVVNIASGSSNLNQVNKLETLYQLHKDSLMIVAVPSNSFGNEPLNNIQLKNWLLLGPSPVHFVVCQKSEVKGLSSSALFNWLSDADKNGMFSAKPSKDFYKFLIDKEGKLIGTFTDEIDPLSSEINEAIAL